MSLSTWIAVALAGAVGAPFRFLVERSIQSRTGWRFPFGTLIVNASGSLIFSFVAGMAIYHGFPDAPKTVIATGFCGAYTTFSTFTFETVRLNEQGVARIAASYVVGSIVLGWSMAAVGMALAGL